MDAIQEIELPDVTYSIEMIKEKIAILSKTEDGEPLKGAMNSLKKALKANPDACNLLLPEEIGELTKAIYRINGKTIAESAAKAGRKKGSALEKGLAKIDLTDPNTLKEIEDDLL